MKRVFINALNAKSGGGRAIITNFLSVISKKGGSNSIYVVLAPDQEFANKFNDCESFEFIFLPSFLCQNILYPLVNSIVIPRLLKKSRCVVAFNLSDIGIPSPLKQVLLFDWPYAAYPKSPAWQRLDGYGFISRKLKLFLFQRYLKYCNVIACQSEVMRDLVKANYPEAKSVVIIPNAVSVDNLVVESSRIWDFNSQKINLLCLTYYYPHKNVEIFIELAEIIVRNCAPFVIVCTISEDQHPKAKKFIEEVKAKGLESVIRLVGAVSMPDVPSLYKACHALLLPTLLESFSGTYVEAFFHRIPVFTSDLEFAKGVCGNGAFYFDPLDAASIYNCLDQAFANPELILQRVDQGAQLLSMMPDWVSVTEKFEQVLDAMV